MEFVKMVRSNEKMIPYKEIYNIANIVLCGQESLKKEGKKIYFNFSDLFTFSRSSKKK